MLYNFVVDFYAGVKQKCKITISTGREDIIPQDGVLRLSSNTGIKFVPKPDSKEHLSELNLTLPTVDKCSDWSEYVTVYSPSVYKEPKLLLVGGDDDFVFPVASKPTAWNHEVCNMWLILCVHSLHTHVMLVSEHPHNDTETIIIIIIRAKHFKLNYE